MDTFKILHHSKGNLIIWPEGGIPTSFNLFIKQNPSSFPKVQRLIKKLNIKLKKQHSYVLSGTFYSDLETKKQYNSIVLMPAQNNYQYYFKQKLVPFGEYFPLPFLSKPITKALNVPMSNLSPGDAQQPPLSIKEYQYDYKITPLICYDTGYSYLVRKDTQGKQVIVVISDDSWFGKSSALKQQLQIDRMRAIETGRYVLVANNVGISAIINSKGDLIKQLPTYKHAILSGVFRTAHGETPFMKWGYLAIWFVILLMLIVGAIPSSTRERE